LGGGAATCSSLHLEFKIGRRLDGSRTDFWWKEGFLGKPFGSEKKKGLEKGGTDGFRKVGANLKDQDSVAGFGGRIWKRRSRKSLISVLCAGGGWAVRLASQLGQRVAERKGEQWCVEWARHRNLRSMHVSSRWQGLWGDVRG